MTDVINATAKSDTHDIRKLKWQNEQLEIQLKKLGKQLGKQGVRIYELRCQLAEVREASSRIARGELKDYERAVERMDGIIRGLEAENARLTTQLNAKLVAVVNGATSVTDNPQE